jgi:hypothetical protein
MSKRAIAFLAGTSFAMAFNALAADATVDGASSAPARMLKSDYRIAKDKLEAEYRAAKRGCEEKRGADERACARDAEASHEKAERELRAAFYGDRGK